MLNGKRVHSTHSLPSCSHPLKRLGCGVYRRQNAPSTPPQRIWILGTPPGAKETVQGPAAANETCATTIL